VTPTASRLRSSYARIEQLFAEQRSVILDGAVATELQSVELAAHDRQAEQELWGTWALYQTPDSVLDVHRRYVDVGCDVISTDTWSILDAPEAELRTGPGRSEPSHWMDIARLGIRLARRAVDEGGKEDECAVAFALSGAALSNRHTETVALLSRVFDEEPPDLILLETLSLIRDDLLASIELLLETGLPLWLSFRRCRHGVCGVYGQHWGPPEGDLFGRAAHRLEEMGVSALLINCLPVSHVPGMLPWLRDFTDLPLGVYPNLGYMTGNRWRFDDEIGPDRYAELALEWREEGAQIIGGCCGTTPEHIAAAAKALEGTRPGRARPDHPRNAVHDSKVLETARIKPWVDERQRSLYPLPFPELTIDPGVFVPTQGSFLCWKHLFSNKVGEDQRCLDVGCGCGILAVQLGLNGAKAVHAIDIDRNAVANTLGNAFRNGVSERISAEALDLYQWEPTESFDVVVASLHQMPVDPFEEPSGHRPLDYWGRSLLDHFLGLLPKLLSPEGRAYVMQLSIIGQGRTAEILATSDLDAEVVDFSFFPFSDLFKSNREQIERVEARSDAYHLQFKEEDVMVAYLLELSKKSG
jgi:S-methylmethionine-dependent homocysteine/selenocysteine methylase/SAM-dependent methyltransferase